MNGDEHVEEPDVTAGRRAFLKRMAALAFAAPVISTFALDSAAFAGPSNHDGNKKNPCPPNQYGQNQTQKIPPGQYGQNQTGQIPPGQTLQPPPNQYGQNQTVKEGKPCPPPNQYGQNQTKISKYSRHW